MTEHILVTLDVKQKFNETDSATNCKLLYFSHINKFNTLKSDFIERPSKVLCALKTPDWLQDMVGL